jgi:hypothetical protein
VDAGDDMIKDASDESVRDAALIAAAQRVERYEIAAYCDVRRFAQILGGEVTGGEVTDGKFTTPKTAPAKLQARLPIPGIAAICILSAYLAGFQRRD